jgi:hypothetical protein
MNLPPPQHDHTPPSAFQISVARSADEQKGKDLPPALVEAIRDDPNMMQPVARVYAATVMHEMFKESKGYTPAQKKDFVELCAKVGDLQPKKDVAQNTGPAFSIQINIPGQPTTGVTIDANPALVVSDE